MFKRAEFVKSVFTLADLPPPKYPEVAILGRSNAGKSSLINALFNQRNLAKVSSTPGFTKALNFFLVDRKFYLVDLPGYGYAKVSKEMRLKWKELIEGYLRSVRDFRLLILIFDIRRTPDELDLSLIEFVKSLNKPYHIVLNKIDLLEKREVMERTEVYKEIFHLTDEELSLTSCKERIGIASIRMKVQSVI
jgi:GTP-binding protein